jgi:hypothetical protein
MFQRAACKWRWSSLQRDYPTIGLSLERRRKLLKEMETDSVYGRLIDRGPIDKIIFKDGDQGIVLMNMDMEYLLV